MIHIKMKRKYASFANIMTVLFVISINPNARVLADKSAEDVPQTSETPKKIQQNVEKTIIHDPSSNFYSFEQADIGSLMDHAHTKTPVNSNIIQGRIYSSLVKILHNMKQQIDKTNQRRMDLNLDKTDAINPLQPQSRRAATEDAFYGNQFDDLPKASKSHRDTFRSNQDLETTRYSHQLDTQNLPYNAPPGEKKPQLTTIEIFNDATNPTGMQMVGDNRPHASENKGSKSRSENKIVYSSYLGPTIDNNESPKDRKPSTPVTGISQSQSWTTFSPKYETSAQKSPSMVETESDVLIKPLSAFNPAGDITRQKSEAFYSNNGYSGTTTADLQTSKNGFSPQYNEATPTFDSNDLDDPLSYQDATGFQTTRPPTLKSVNKVTKRGHRPRQRGGSMNQKYLRGVDYFSEPDIDAHLEQMEIEGGRASKILPLIGDTQVEPGIRLPKKSSHQAIGINQVYSLQHQPQPSQQVHVLTPTQQQQVFYNLANLPQMQMKGTSTSQASINQLLNSGATGLAFDASATGQQPQRDLTHQPQTIQITAVPNLGFNNNQGSLVRVNNGLGSILTNGFNGINGWLDPLGRQVLMVNAERRQIDWSFLIWPILLVVALPLILSALFVPIFLKSIVILIQILQSLGLVMPISGTIGQLYKATGANVTSSM